MEIREQIKDDYIGTPLSTYSKIFLNFNVGDILPGKVVKVGGEIVVVEVGTRNAGDIPLDEFKETPLPKAGDEFYVYVVDIEEKEGKLLLSKKKADFELSWQKIEDIFQKQEKIKCKVLRSVKQGLVVEVLNFTGFVPLSKLDVKKIEDLYIYEGKDYEFKIIDLDKNEQKIILSRRKVIEEEIERKKENIFTTSREGDILEGTVEKILSHSALINVDGILGIVHISEIAWRRISSPTDVLKEGEKVKCKILSKNREEKKIELSIKQAQPNPWEKVDQKFYIGQIIEGEILRIFDFGAFVKVDEQIEGLIPTSEMSEVRINRAQDVVRIGEKVKVKIIDLKKYEQRMIFSLKAAKKEEERQTTADLPPPKGTTLGEIIGDMLKDKE